MLQAFTRGLQGSVSRESSRTATQRLGPTPSHAQLIVGFPQALVARARDGFTLGPKGSTVVIIKAALVNAGRTLRHRASLLTEELDKELLSSLS
jgi:hypothetical protein